ncbi:TatD family hydrolase [uncultured Paraglaciecola sp.]|uniref:TatD family hydrolase n=1 Tax=uncultured Paraglaciecola sp. TaxID=1765024 RepID=UPI0026279E6B|nr:TatD family hydrolase [uncultured Paraglaciecola sp.]
MLIDSHCHLDFSCFDHDRSDVIKRCSHLGVEIIVIPGTQDSSWQKQIDLCDVYPQLRFALGLHPYFLENVKPAHLTHLSTLLQRHQSKVLALGEIGLDSHIDVDWQLQVQIFEQQLILANEHHLPIILHHRNSHNELIRLLKVHKFIHGGIIHGFSGSLQTAKSYIDLGFKIGVGGTITYARATKTRHVIGQLPLDSLVLETDAPDMPLEGKQGQRNSPEYLPEVLETLLSLRSETKQQILLACLNNVKVALPKL